jgi:hypothetical protein
MMASFPNKQLLLDIVPYSLIFLVDNETLLAVTGAQVSK